MDPITLTDVDQSMPKTLSEARVLHTRCLARLWAFAEQRGVLLRHEEGFVKTPRQVMVGGAKEVCADAVHMRGSVHYEGLANDHTVVRPDPATGELAPVVDGGDPVWRELGEFWKSLHPLCRWGGDFAAVDANHMSLTWGGVE